jgi:hypothetical protein
LANGRIYKRTSGGVYSLVYTDAENVCSGASQWYDSVGNTFLTWACTTKLHRKQILNSSGAAVNTNWSDVDATVNGQTYPKTNLSTATYHTMRQSVGVLLITNVNVLAQVGYDDSYTNNALQLIPGNIAKTLLERNIATIIGCYRLDSKEQSMLVGWDGLSLSWNSKQIFPTSSINALIDTEVPLAQVGSNGQLYYADMTGILPITKFPGGGQCDPDGVDADAGVALFGVYGNGSGYSGIYSYGRKKKNAPLTLNLEYQFDCDQIGTLKKVGSTVMFSYKSGSNYGVKKVDSSNKATATYQSLDLKAPVKKDSEPIWNYVRLIMSPHPAGSTVQVYRRMDKNGSFVICNLDGGSNSYSTTDGQEAVFYIGDKGKYCEIQIVTTPSGNTTPEILQVEVDVQ